VTTRLGQVHDLMLNKWRSQVWVRRSAMLSHSENSNAFDAEATPAEMLTGLTDEKRKLLG
jgi:hypothetical protein